MSRLYDVIIVGCGPAGATAGYMLARKGLDVLILEKKNLPRFKLCAGMLTQKTLDFGDSLFPGWEREMEEKGIIRTRNWRYSIRDKQKYLYTDTSSNPFVLVDREKYDHLWSERAVQAGARIHQDWVVQVDVFGSRVITHSGRYYRGRYILGADGGSSRVRKALAREKAVHPPWSRGAALALETFVPRDTAELPEHPELIVGLVPDGYAWSFPGQSQQRVGICSSKILDGRVLKSRLQEVLSWHGLLGVQAEVKGHVLPYGDYEKRPGFQNILLMGDAAGLADPLLGEGIYYAHSSAARASEAVLGCWSKTDRTAHLYARLLSDIVRDMRNKWVLRKMGLGLLPLLEIPPLNSLLPNFFPRLETRIQKS